jgi:nucleoside-diphosphate-sugar epimerase
VRRLLGAHISGRRIATALRKRGHDVRATDEKRDLDGTIDEALLELATDDGRSTVTFNVADFPDLAAAGPSNAGPTLAWRSL